MSKQSKQVVYVLMGLPGAGKSTWAINKVKTDNHVVIVSRDDIRFILKRDYIYDGSKKHQLLVKDFSNYLLKKALIKGYDVVLDQMSLTKKDRKQTFQRIRRLKKRIRIVLVYFPEKQKNVEKILQRKMKWGDKKYYTDLIEKLKNIIEEPHKSEDYDSIELLYYRSDI